MSGMRLLTSTTSVLSCPSVSRRAVGLAATLPHHRTLSSAATPPSSTGGGSAAGGGGGARRAGHGGTVPVSGTMNGVQWYNSSCARRCDLFGGLDVTLLGTAASYPSRFRNVSCTVLRLAARGTPMRTWLFDCGEGSQRQANQSALASLAGVDRVFITHLHGDHVFGLLGLVASRAAWFLPQTHPVMHVYGPHGLAAFLASTVGVTVPTRVVVHELLKPSQQPSAATRVSDSDVSNRGTAMGLVVNPVYPDPDGKWTVFSDEHHEVTAGSIAHTVPCVGYVVQESDLPGAIDVAAASERGLFPGPAYAELKAGETVTTPAGDVVRPEDVVGPPILGRKVVILGDTHNPYKMQDMAMDADLLVHEATMCSGSDKDAAAAGHSTPSMAGMFAAAIRARRTVLTHFSNKDCSAFRDAAVEALPSSDRVHRIQPVENVAEHAYPAMSNRSFMAKVTDVAQEAAGMETIIAARDFMAFPVPRPGSGIEE